MNPYVGKTCPYCKTAIKEDDDIVICSKCEMPHHKECWVENGSCTTFGCDGTIQSISNSPAIEKMGVWNGLVSSNGKQLPGKNFCPQCGTKHHEEEKYCGRCGFDFSSMAVAEDLLEKSFNSPDQGADNLVEQIEIDLSDVCCPKCGAQRFDGERFCGKCGYSYLSAGLISKDANVASMPFVSATENVSQTYMPEQIQHTGSSDSKCVHTEREYVDKKTEYYMPQFELLAAGNKAAFNWSAFFFDLSWFSYRKMYGYATVVFVIAFVIGLLGPYGRLFSFIVKLYIGFKANAIYQKRIKECIGEELKLPKERREKYFNKKKGTSIIGMILMEICLYGIAILVVVLQNF